MHLIRNLLKEYAKSVKLLLPCSLLIGLFVYFPMSYTTDVVYFPQGVLLGQYVSFNGDQQAVYLTRQPDGRMMVYPSKRRSVQF